MLRVLCPNCGEISYTPDVEAFYPCPRCEFFFSGKFGQDRRKEPRLAKKMNVTFLHQGRKFSAKTFDVSPKGVGIEILGFPHLAVKDVLAIGLKKLGISSAKVVWVKADDRKAMIGLEKTN